MFVIVLFINLKKTNNKQVDLEFHYQPREFFAQAKLFKYVAQIWYSLFCSKYGFELAYRTRTEDLEQRIIGF